MLMVELVEHQFQVLMLMLEQVVEAIQPLELVAEVLEAGGGDHAAGDL